MQLVRGKVSLPFREAFEQTNKSYTEALRAWDGLSHRARSVGVELPHDVFLAWKKPRVWDLFTRPNDAPQVVFDAIGDLKLYVEMATKAIIVGRVLDDVAFNWPEEVEFYELNPRYAICSAFTARLIPEDAAATMLGFRDELPCDAIHSTWLASYGLGAGQPIDTGPDPSGPLSFIHQSRTPHSAMPSVAFRPVFEQDTWPRTRPYPNRPGRNMIYKQIALACDVGMILYGCRRRPALPRSVRAICEVDDRGSSWCLRSYLSEVWRCVVRAERKRVMKPVPTDFRPDQLEKTPEAKPDGTFNVDRSSVWYEGSEHSLPSGQVFRLIRFMWGRETATYDSLHDRNAKPCQVFDDPQNDSTIKSRVGDANKAMEELRELGLKWRLSVNKTKRKLNKSPA